MGEINHEKEHFHCQWLIFDKFHGNHYHSLLTLIVDSFEDVKTSVTALALKFFVLGNFTIIVNFKKLNKWSFFWLAHNDIPFISDDWMIDVFQFTSLLAQGRISNPVPSFLSLYQVFPVFHHSSLWVMQLTHQLSH